jgi:hypothetical protein
LSPRVQLLSHRLSRVTGIKNNHVNGNQRRM